MVKFTNEIAKRCARWILLETSPAPLPMLHPVRDDMAAAADEIDRLQKLIPNEPQTSGWQPIETAPKDGTVIEIINMDAYDPQPFPAHWAQNAGWGDEPAWLIGWPEMWAAGRSAWRATLSAKRNAAACLGILETPTHWQPRCSLSRPDPKSTDR